ncbi:MAG TPA: GHKL domain-containing protein, partial [Syntrophomonas sp.]|nr:GHKL domain-containing protein [Syntrophomonas sp.]
LFSIKRIEKNAKYHTSNLLLKNHLTQMESILTSSQAQRHEYSKHMQNLQALIELNKIEEAKAYVNGLTENYWSKPTTVSPINHPAVEGLINSKNAVAQVQNIDFAVAVKCDMSKIHIPDWDLCSILGNLLDNAFEAAAADEEPRVGIEFKHEDNRFAIYINNNGLRISDPERVLAAGYTTKASEGRGYGLYVVNKLAPKYQGTIEIITRPKTTVILRFPGGNDIYD